MRSRSNEPVARRPSNLSLDADLVAQAKELDINLSRAAESGIARAVADEKARRWKIENAEAIREFNEWVETNELPLAQYRQF